MLEVSDLRYVAPDGRLLLASVSLTLGPGQYAWLSGPSGSGKSTLLRLLNRLISPQAGQIVFQGRALERWPVGQMRRRLLLVGQTAVLVPGDVAHNLLLPFGFRAAKELPRPDESALAAALAAVGLEALGLGQDVGGLSVGQAQRLCLTRALLLGPDILLLDEPLAPLDPASQGLVERRIAAFAADGGAALMVSHQRPALANHAWRLADGALEDLP